MSDWTGTAFCADREAAYSISWQADNVSVTRHHGVVTVEFTDAERRAYFVLPVALLPEAPDFLL